MSDEYNDPTLEDDMRTTLRAMARIFVTDPDDLHDFYENIENILSGLMAGRSERTEEESE